jgi:hypothetical protein
MATQYTLNFSDPSKTTTVVINGPTKNNYSTSLDLVGPGYVAYGETIAQDFLKLLENFASPNPGYALERGNGGQFEMFYPNSPIVFSEWRNIIVVISSNVIKFFENGILKDTIPYSSPFTRNGNKLSIGSRFVENAVTPPCNFFIGKIDDVRIYNRALNQVEITYLSKN